MNSFWVADLPVMTLLAVCRILIFSNIINAKKFPFPIKIVLFSLMSWIFFVIVSGSITQNMKFSPPWWGYDYEMPYAEVFDSIEIYLSFPCLAISYLAYLIIIFLIYCVSIRNLNYLIKIQ